MSSRKNRSPEEQARRAKIRELLELSDITSMEDIHSLFKETIAEFLEKGLDAELEGDIEAHIRDIYGIDVSDSTVSRITDKILPVAKG